MCIMYVAGQEMEVVMVAVVNGGRVYVHVLV
jgi:hypothetical protein